MQNRVTRWLSVMLFWATCTLGAAAQGLDSQRAFRATQTVGTAPDGSLTSALSQQVVPVNFGGTTLDAQVADGARLPLTEVAAIDLDAADLADLVARVAYQQQTCSGDWQVCEWQHAGWRPPTPSELLQRFSSRFNTSVEIARVGALLRQAVVANRVLAASFVFRQTVWPALSMNAATPSAVPMALTWSVSVLEDGRVLATQPAIVPETSSADGGVLHVRYVSSALEQSYDPVSRQFVAMNPDFVDVLGARPLTLLSWSVQLPDGSTRPGSQGQHILDPLDVVSTAAYNERIAVVGGDAVQVDRDTAVRCLVNKVDACAPSGQASAPAFVNLPDVEGLMAMTGTREARIVYEGLVEHRYGATQDGRWRALVRDELLSRQFQRTGCALGKLASTWQRYAQLRRTIYTYAYSQGQPDGLRLIGSQTHDFEKVSAEYTGDLWVDVTPPRELVGTYEDQSLATAIDVDDMVDYAVMPMELTGGAASLLKLSDASTYAGPVPELEVLESLKATDEEILRGGWVNDPRSRVPSDLRRVRWEPYPQRGEGWWIAQYQDRYYDPNAQVKYPQDWIKPAGTPRISRGLHRYDLVNPQAGLFDQLWVSNVRYSGSIHFYTRVFSIFSGGPYWSWWSYLDESEENLIFYRSAGVMHLPEDKSIPFKAWMQTYTRDLDVSMKDRNLFGADNKDGRLWMRWMNMFPDEANSETVNTGSLSFTLMARVCREYP